MTLPRRPFALAAPLLLVACSSGGTPAGSGPGDAPGNAPESAVAIGVSEAGCDPTTLAAQSGQVVFEITNKGDDVAEFEVIGPDARVVDEAENIVPGFVVNLSTRLDGGTYELVCGNLSAPRGALTVSGGAAATPAPNKVVDAATLAPIVSAYKAYVITEADELVKRVATFTGAIDRGDLAGAKAAYGPARVPWERIEPIAELFSDIDPKVDAREDDFDGGAADPAFGGFHRLEKGLWVDGTTAGLADVAGGLRTNVAELRSRLDTLEIEPRVMARGAGELIDEVAQSKMTGEEDRYSKLDLWSISPNVEGSKKIVDLLRPVIEGIDRDYLAGLDGAYARVQTIIAKYGDETTGFETFDKIDPTELKTLQAALADLSERLAELPGRLGLEA